MLTESQFSEIREHLESSQNPLFLFDNDVDGLVSFLLLRRFLGRGKGFAIKSFPELDEQYTRRIEEFGSDKIFILDKPLVSKEFLEYCNQRNLPVIWIDHHPTQNPEGVYYYNPMDEKKPSREPTSYLCWKVVNRDEWLAIIGCIADQYMPDFAEEFVKKYPDLLTQTVSAEDALFKSEVGKLVIMLSHGMKDTTTNVMKMIRALIEAENPYEILSRGKKFETMLKRYDVLNKVHSKLLKKALAQKDAGKIIFFKYGGEMAMSRGLSNELFYLNGGKKIVLVAHIKGDTAKISMTGPEDKDLREIVAKVLETIDGTGGGHKRAVGSSINAEDLDKFKEIVEGCA